MKTTHLNPILAFCIIAVMAGCPCGLLQTEMPASTPFPDYLEQAVAQSERIKPRPSLLEETISSLEAQVKANPNDVRAHIMLGQEYYITFSHRKAIEQLDRAIALDPELSDGHCALGNIIYDLGLLNMLVKKEYYTKEFKEGGIGLVFTPGESSRLLFAHAVEKYKTAKTHTRTLTQQSANDVTIMICDVNYLTERVQFAQRYASGERFEDAFSALDQMRAATWLLELETVQRQEAISKLQDTADSWAATLTSKVQQSNRPDAEDLIKIIRLKTALDKYMVFCTLEGMGGGHSLLVERSQQGPAIIQGLADLGYNRDDALVSIIARNACPEDRKDWKALETKVVQRFLDQERIAAINLYNLTPLGASFSGNLRNLETGSLGPSGERDTIALIESLKSELALSDELRQGLDQLITNLKLALNGELEWQTVHAQADVWLNQVVDYTLTLP
jgi:tetratricopeptide (TPR) repeat protein